MSDRYDITCECDYTNRVPAHALGTTRACVNCSADLFIDPEKAVAVVDKSDANHERRLRDAMAAGKSTEFVRRPDSSSSSALSEPDTAQPTKSPTQQPMANNPFADEDAEPDDSPFAVPSAPPSRVEDVEPAPSRSRYVEIPTISSLDKASGETCASCGRTLRGQWDRVETPEGVVCYICSNQATEFIPERIKDRPEVSLTNEPAVLYDVPERERTDNKTLFGIDTESEGFKRFILYIAFGTIALAFIVYLTGAFDSPSVGTTQSAGGETGSDFQAPDWVGTAMLLWQFSITPFFAIFLALYFVLSMTANLPQDKFFQDAVYLSIFCAVFTVFHFVLSFVLHYIAQVPIAGPIYAILIPLSEFLIFGLVLNIYLDMRVVHIFLVFIGYRIFGVVVNVLGAALFGLLYQAIN